MITAGEVREFGVSSLSGGFTDLYLVKSKIFSESLGYFDR